MVVTIVLASGMWIVLRTNGMTGEMHHDLDWRWAKTDEERILARQADPVRYNDETIFPDKVSLNLRYLDECSLRLDLRYLWITLFGR